MKHFLYIFLLLSLASCGPKGNSFRIRGNFRDMQTGELYIYNQDGDHARLDTLTVQEGRFQYKGEADESTPYILVFPNGVEQVIFVKAGDDLTYEASANDLKNYTVSGNDENKLMNKFREETYTMNPSMMRGVARAYIKDNPASPVAIYLLDQYFIQDEEASDKELSPLLKELKAHHPHNHHLLDIASKLKGAERHAIGQKLPDITLTKPDQKQVKLWAKQKDYTLIAFWAAWAPKGYDLLWTLRRVCEPYTTDGKLRIVAISLDVERFNWENAARQDSTGIVEHYCDGGNLESKAVKTLGINSVPYYMLIDKHHKVLDSSDDPNKLEGMLKKYIRKGK